MAKNLLSAPKVKGATYNTQTQKPKKYNDGQGLYLIVFKSGLKSWRYDFMFNGKYQTLTYGAYPELSLAEARQLHREALIEKQQGRNPAEKKQIEKYKLNEDSFQAVAEEWYQVNRDTWVERTAARKQQFIHEYLNPYIGNRNISELEPPEILYALRKIEAKHKIDTAHRVKQTASQIMRFAVATGRAKRDITLDLRGALKPIMTKHRPAITDPKGIGQLLRALHNYQGDERTQYALKLLPYVFVRMGEFRTMQWVDIDFDKKQWYIPAHKMKMKLDHIVPLAGQAIELLEKLQPLQPYSDYVFTSVRSRHKPMSENTINHALRRLGYAKDEMCSHGFRSIASTCLNELGFRADVIERQLAHIESNKVRAAYNRSQYLEERINMMQTYANYLDNLRVGGKVVAFKESKVS